MQLILIFSPIMSFAQYIQYSKVDSLSHQKRVISKVVNMVPGLSFKSGIQSISFYAIDRKAFMVLNGEGQKYAGTITADDLCFLMTDQDTIALRSAGLQTAYGRFEAAHFDHQFLIDQNDLMKLSEHTLQRIQYANSKGVFVFEVMNKARLMIKEMAKSFLNEAFK